MKTIRFKGTSKKVMLLLERISNKLVLAVLAIIVTLFLLFIVLPTLSVFLRIDPSQVPAQLQNPIILDAISLGLITSTVAAIGAFVFAVPTAYFLATRNFRGKSVINTLIDLPIVLPPAVAGVALLLAFAPRGLLGPILTPLGIILPGSVCAVILAQMFVASPFILTSAKAGFENVDQNVVNSAKILSGSRLRVFLTVTLPMAGRAVISGIIMTWTRAMGEFGATIMFAGNLPGKTQTMPLAIYSLMTQDPWGAGIVLSAIMIGLSFTILIVVKLLSSRKFGVKQ
jgi:molybdate transport system permease protein